MGPYLTDISWEHIWQTKCQTWFFCQHDMWPNRNFSLTASGIWQKLLVTFLLNLMINLWQNLLLIGDLWQYSLLKSHRIYHQHLSESTALMRQMVLTDSSPNMTFDRHPLVAIGTFVAALSDLMLLYLVTFVPHIVTSVMCQSFCPLLWGFIIMLLILFLWTSVLVADIYA